MNLSINFKESFKTALAMTIAIGIALAMDWQQAYWAGFAVAFCSLATIGQSLEKSALRMGGTLVAVVIALWIIALFGQDRWLFIIFISIYGAVCAYLMSFSANAYFWQICWVVVLLVSIKSGGNPVNAFETSMLRLQETGLGILVYSLVSVLIWPQHTGPKLEQTAINLVALQRQLLQACLAAIENRQEPPLIHDLADQERRVRAEFDQLLRAARVDTSDVRQMHQQWQEFQHELAGFSLAVTLWRETFAELKKVDVKKLLPNLGEFGAEIDRRHDEMRRVLADSGPTGQPESVALHVNKEELAALPPLRRATLGVSQSHLLDIERITRKQMNSLATIRALNPGTSPPTVLQESSPGLFVPDPDHLTGAIRLAMMMWMSFLAIIFIGDLPGGFNVLLMSGSIGIVLANAPQLRISLVYRPLCYALALASLLYLLVMPALSSYLGLGAMIFAVTFAICFAFAAPPRALSKIVCLAVFLTLCGFTNDQSYNFLTIPTTIMMFLAVFVVFNLGWYFPFNLMPERVFLRQLRRFFRSCHYLLSEPGREQVFPKWLIRRQRAFHIQEIARLPARLSAWPSLIDTPQAGGASVQDVQTLVAAVTSMSIQLQQIIEQRTSSNPEITGWQLPPEFSRWRQGLQAGLHRLASEQDLVAVSQELRAHIEDLGKELTVEIEQSFAQHQAEFSQQIMETYCRLLDACRGTSVALFQCTHIMADIDWGRWQQERFA